MIELRLETSSRKLTVYPIMLTYILRSAPRPKLSFFVVDKKRTFSVGEKFGAFCKWSIHLTDFLTVFEKFNGLFVTGHKFKQPFSKFLKF